MDSFSTRLCINGDEPATYGCTEAPNYVKLLEAPSYPLPEEQGGFGNSHLRLTVLFAALVVALALTPAWLPLLINPGTAAWVCYGVVTTNSLLWAVIAACAVRNFGRLHTLPVALPYEVKTFAARKFRHVVIVPCYLDPLDVLLHALQSLAEQSAKDRLVVVVTFEARTPDLDTKRSAVCDKFQGVFGDFLVVVHHLEPQTEIPGGCSNKNFALREAYKYITTQHSGFSTTRYTLTTCDTDSLFPGNYFDAVEACYNRENPNDGAPVSMVVWQPPLFYNWDLDQRPFFNRVTCLMRSLMMLGGLISFNLNPMSVFTYPLELGVTSGFINPRYGVDDIIAKVRWMCSTNSSVPVRLLPVIVISGPTNGLTIGEEAVEWGRQIRRWIVGASESFHYFLIHYRGKPLLSAIVWFVLFFAYYAVLLCCSSLFAVIMLLPLPWGIHPESDPFMLGTVAVTPQRLGCAALALQMLSFAVAFGIDRCAVQKLGIVESIGLLRNAAHYVSSPFVLLAYSMISFVSVVRFAFEGKRLAKHDMAGKAALSPTVVAIPPQQSGGPHSAMVSDA